MAKFAASIEHPKALLAFGRSMEAANLHRPHGPLTRVSAPGPHLPWGHDPPDTAG